MCSLLLFLPEIQIYNRVVIKSNSIHISFCTSCYFRCKHPFFYLLHGSQLSNTFRALWSAPKASIATQLPWLQSLGIDHVLPPYVPKTFLMAQAPKSNHMLKHKWFRPKLVQKGRWSLHWGFQAYEDSLLESESNEFL